MVIYIKFYYMGYLQNQNGVINRDMEYQLIGVMF